MMLQRFIVDPRASVAPMLALTILPLFAAMGAAVDFSRASSAKAAMQAAVDAAAIIMAKQAQNADLNQLNATATSYFSANFNNTDVASPQVRR